MAKKNRRIASPKKETIRKLDMPSLSPDELVKVHGGKLPYTTPCLTLC